MRTSYCQDNTKKGKNKLKLVVLQPPQQQVAHDICPQHKTNTRKTF
jgi:hypothetical protein